MQSPIDSTLLKILICPDCGNDLELGAERDPTFQCVSCNRSYGIIDGIPDLTPQKRYATPGAYRSETFKNITAGIYDIAAPLASITTWQCSPLRYLEMAATSLGRANGGLLVAAPIGTGIVLEWAIAYYHDLTIIGFDSSWEMLRQAQKRFAAEKRVKIFLVRCDLTQIPLREGRADAVLSLNGLHSTVDRVAMLNNFARIGREGGDVSGSALIRGVTVAADFALNQLEKWGITPILRTSEFLIKEMESSNLSDIKHTTAGAVLFWGAKCHRENVDSSLTGERER